MMKYSMTMKF